MIVSCVVSAATSSALSQCHQRRNHQIRDGQRQQKLPSKRHQLVITETRQRAAHPNIDKQKYKNSQHEPEHRQNDLQNRRPENRPAPSAQEQDRGQAATVIMLAYSAMKNMANFMALYSV